MERTFGDVIVRPSPIQGLGVFAARDFRAGEVIFDTSELRLVTDEHPLGEGEEERHCDWLADGRQVLLPEPARYINHSCDPNVFVRTIDGIRHVLALRDIRTGEEITYDYCVNGYGDVVWHCNCGADRCRGTIHSDFFHLPLDLQWQYLPLLDEWFRKERSEDIEKLKARGPQGHSVPDRHAIV